MSGLKEWDGEAVDETPVSVLTAPTVVGSLSNTGVLGLFEFGEAIKK